jgi:uncharacterized protein YkwD
LSAPVPCWSPTLARERSARAGRASGLTADLACDQFSHTPCCKPFQSIFAAYLRGASSYQIGENIALASGDFSTPRQTMNLWLHSADHRKNILAPGFRALGIGYQARPDLPGQ